MEKNLTQKRIKNFIKGKGFKIDRLCYEWFCRVRDKNLLISSPLTQKKAGEIAENLGEINFKASIGWLEKFRTRHNIVYKAICGESNSVNIDVVNNRNSKLIEMCEGFILKKLF